MCIRDRLCLGFLQHIKAVYVSHVGDLAQHLVGEGGEMCIRDSPDMDILKQCQKWHEEDKHQKIVDALEAISVEERTPEMDMELARAYNNLADSSEPEGRKLRHQALELRQSREEELGDTCLLYTSRCV